MSDTHSSAAFLEGVRLAVEENGLVDITDHQYMSDTAPHGVPMIRPRANRHVYTAFSRVSAWMNERPRLKEFLVHSGAVMVGTPIYNIAAGGSTSYGYFLTDDARRTVQLLMDMYPSDRPIYVRCSSGNYIIYGVSIEGMRNVVVKTFASRGADSPAQYIQGSRGTHAFLWNHAQQKVYTTMVGTFVLKHRMTLIPPTFHHSPSEDLGMIHDFGAGIGLIIPGLDANWLIEHGGLYSLTVNGLDTSSGCACGMTASSIDMYRAPTANLPGEVLASSDIASHAMPGSVESLQLQIRFGLPNQVRVPPPSPEPSSNRGVFLPITLIGELMHGQSDYIMSINRAWSSREVHTIPGGAYNIPDFDIHAQHGIPAIRSNLPPRLSVMFDANRAAAHITRKFQSFMVESGCTLFGSSIYRLAVHRVPQQFLFLAADVHDAVRRFGQYFPVATYLRGYQEYRVRTITGVDIRFIQGRDIAKYVQENCAGSSSFWWDLEGQAVRTNAAGLMMLRYWVNLLTSGHQVRGELARTLANDFNSGIGLLVPDLNVESFIENKTIGSLQFEGLDTSAGCACGIRAARITVDTTRSPFIQPDGYNEWAASHDLPVYLEDKDGAILRTYRQWCEYRTH